MFTLSFARAAFERALKAFAGALLAFLPASATGAVPTLNWGDMLTFSAYAGLASLLLSVASYGVGNAGPSLGAEKLNPTPGGDAGITVTELCMVVIAVAVVVLAMVALGWIG
jgi:hypothetical protein